MTIPETIDSLLAETENRKQTPDEARALIMALGVDSAECEEMIFISQGGSDLLEVSGEGT